MITLTNAVVKQMSAHKLTNKVVINRMGLGIGLHRRFHTTQRKPLYEDMASQFMGKKPCHKGRTFHDISSKFMGDNLYENDTINMLQEMFSKMNMEYMKRFCALEKDNAKCQRAVQDLGLSLTRLESKLDTGHAEMHAKSHRAVQDLGLSLTRLENNLGLSMTRLESKVDTGQAEMQGKILNGVGLRHWVGSGFLSTRKPIISDKGNEKTDVVLRFFLYILICQLLFNLGRSWGTTAVDKTKTAGEDSNSTNDNNRRDKKK